MIEQTSLLAPLVSLTSCTLAEANALLVAWHHRMGPIERPLEVRDIGRAKTHCYVLLHGAAPVAVATHSWLIAEHVGGGLQWITGENGVELSRLCAARPGLCRVMLRLWREFVFPSLGKRYAISYQDADLHSGNTYRFDGWRRSPERSRSGTDNRSGKRGRNKWVWYWELPAPALERAS